MEIYKLLDYSYMMQQKKKVKEKFAQATDLLEIKIAVLCGSTFGEVQDFLEVFLLHYGIKPMFLIGEYNRVYEEACFPNAALKEFAPDIILIHVTNKNLRSDFRCNESFELSLYEEEQRLLQIWNLLEEQYHCMIIQNNFEYYPYRMIGNAARTNEDGSVKYIDDINGFISSYVRENNHLYLNDIHFLSSYVGLTNWYDDRMWYMYKYPMKMDVMPRYALNIANIIKSVLGKNKKTVITDLDNTLWGDIIGEVGVENIRLGYETPQGEKFVLLQQYLKYLSGHGVVLNICSKNEYETGISGIASKKSVLDAKDFAVKKINWKEKYENIQEILEELNLLPEAAVFIDDSSMECDSVRAMLPEIAVLQMSNMTQTLQQMDTLSFFELPKETAEDKQRNQYYRENIARNEEKGKYENYDDYLKSLEMTCYVDKARKENIDRIVQLFNKTNQFNFLTRRYTMEEVSELSRKPDIEMFVLELQDKFGSNGIVSVSIIRLCETDAYIDGWVMSCRVFARGLEYVMLELVCKLCMERGICTLHGYYKKTLKNSKISNFFGDAGFKEERYDIENEVHEWTCRDIEGLLKICKVDNIMIMQTNV